MPTTQSGKTEVAPNPFRKMKVAMLNNKYRIVPVQPGTKKPAYPTDKGWKLYSNWDVSGPLTKGNFDALKSQVAASMGIVLGTHPALPADERLVSVDLDITDPELKKALGPVAETALGGEDSVWRYGSPLKMGAAFIRVKLPDAAMKLTKRQVKFGGDEKVELLAEGQQVLVGGLHPDGVEYCWRNPKRAIPDIPVSDLPVLTLDELDALLAAFGEAGRLAGFGVNVAGAKAGVKSNKAEAEFPVLDLPSAKTLQAALGAVKNDFQRETWVMICKGYRACCEAALGEDAVVADLEAFDRRYVGGSDGGKALEAILNEHERLPRGFGLWQLVSNLVATLPGDTKEGLLDMQRQASAKHAFSDAPIDNPMLDAQVEAVNEASIPAWVRDTNRRFAFVSGEGATSAMCLVKFAPDGTWTQTEYSLAVKEHANDQIDIGTRRDGTPIRKNRLEAWMTQPGRRSYPNGIKFMPGKPREHDGCLNTWKGWGVDPKPGAWGTIKDHILNIICAGDQMNFDYTIRWIAYRVQNLDGPVGVVPVISGEQGNGKSVFGGWLAKIMGSSCLTVSSSDDVLGKFNIHLRDCNLVVCEEAFFSGDPTFRGKLKSMITDQTLRVEGKFLPSQAVQNHLAMIWLTNEVHSAPVEVTDRRYFAMESAKKKSRAYYDHLVVAADAELPAFFDHLLHLDLSGFVVMDFPKTEARAEQMRYTLKGATRFGMEMLERGQFPKGTGNDFSKDLFKDWDQQPIFIPKDAMRDAMVDFAKQYERGKFVSDREIKAMAEALGGQEEKRRAGESGRERVWRLPPRGLARDALNEALGINQKKQD